MRRCPIEEAQEAQRAAQKLRVEGAIDKAALMERTAIDAELRDPTFNGAARAFIDGDLANAERLVRRYLGLFDAGVAGLCLLADIAERHGVYADAAQLLDRALALAPDFHQATIRRASLAFQLNDKRQALLLLNRIPNRSPDFRRAMMLKGRIYGLSGDYAAAETTYRELQTEFPTDPAICCALGDVLKTLGRAQESCTAFRTALVHDRSCALAWWSISNLKSERFDAADVKEMEGLLANAADRPDRFYIHFALGQAYEQLAKTALAFKHYEMGNAIRLKSEPHDQHDVTNQVDHSLKLFSKSFFSQRRGCGDPAPDPIFVVGLPRSGSTLIEQMLASHSLIEGTSELPDIPLLVHGLISEKLIQGARYPDVLQEIPNQQWAVLGRHYLNAAKIHRKTDRPFFIDKLPNNWLYVGLIHLILPNAKIIDARRAPMACCFSNFKQHFARGQTFAYDLKDLGAYYQDYIRLMRHLDSMLPKRVHRILHEDLVNDPEFELRRLVSALDLEFEPGMLNFHLNLRAVRTASAEQVRQPINADAINQWRAFDAHLGPLKNALGSSFDDYR